MDQIAPLMDDAAACQYPTYLTETGTEMAKFPLPDDLTKGSHSAAKLGQNSLFDSQHRVAPSE